LNKRSVYLRLALGGDESCLYDNAGEILSTKSQKKKGKFNSSHRNTNDENSLDI